MNKTKILAALLLLPFFVWMIGWGPRWLILAAVLVFGAAWGGWESARLIFGEGETAFRLLATAFSVIAGAVAATGDDLYAMIGLVGVFLAGLTIAGLLSADLSAAAGRAAKLLFVAVYPGLLSGYVVALKSYEPVFGGAKLVIVLFALVWINDAGAYFAGTALGKRKLAPRLSPGKTIEGSLGGFAATIVLGALLPAFTPFTFRQGLLLGLVLGVIGPLGDLVESALKRGAGVKDSGTFLPGHGGVLDRIDSVIVCAPILYYYVVLSHYCQLMHSFGAPHQ